MPCYDSRNEPDYVRAEAKLEFQADLDKLTRLLCEAMKLIDETYDDQYGDDAKEELKGDTSTLYHAKTIGYICQRIAAQSRDSEGVTSVSMRENT